MEVRGYGDLEPIYRGHRYIVARSRRSVDDRPVVIKSVAPGVFDSRPADALRREYALLRGLDLDRVARALDLTGSWDRPALVLEDAGPVCLKEWLKHRSLDLATFLPMAALLAETLAGLQARRIVHRDINPRNMVLDVAARTGPEQPGSLASLGPGWRITLVDFDAATAVAGVSHGEGTHDAILGTLAYLAPEQTGRLNRVVDHRADLYSLGVTFYEMLTGSLPFTSSDPVELVHAHLARPPLPPASLDPKLPPALSNVVMKLLAKMPEDRYQSAEALLHDLRAALAQWQGTGTITPFELGRVDLVNALPIPDRLYGREQEGAALTAAIERAAAGANEVLAITGQAGVGKSALVHEWARRALARPIATTTTGVAEETEPMNRFLWGKFEQLRGDSPHAAIVEAFGRLCRSWLEGPADVAQEWRRLLLAALGRNARVMTDLIPELQWLLGEQPAVPLLGAIEAESRFHLTFSAFLRALAQGLRPLVLFLDDLQWADPASLKLLGLWATDPDIHHLLVIFAHRDEVDAEHSLRRALDGVRAAGATVTSLAIAPLDRAAVTALCADAFGAEQARVAPLAEVVHRKTAGNPLFMKRFLRFHHQAELLHFDGLRCRWDWDLAAIEHADVTENVLELMLVAIRRLPERTQHLLKVAACLRRRIELGLLSQLVDESLDQTAGDLWSAIEEGLLVPDQAPATAYTGPEAQSTSYRFVHDRVQQAACSLLEHEERQKIHLAIGRRLRDTASPEELEGRLFEVVDHLHLAAPLLTDREERLQLASLTYRAAAAARAALAYDRGLAYLVAGIAIFPAEAPATDRALLYRLHRDAMQLAHLTGDHTLGDGMADAALAHAETPIEKAGVYNIRIVACSMRAAYREAIEHGRRALSLLGIELDPGDRPAVLAAERAARQRRIDERGSQDLLGLQPMTDPRQLARMELLANLLDPAYVCDPVLLALLVEQMVDLSLRHGNSNYSAFAYTVYGMILGIREGDHATAHAFGRLGVELSRRFADPVQECRTLHIFGAFVNHWRDSVASSVPRLRLAVARALEGGDLHYASYADYTAVTISLHRGTDLAQVTSDLERCFTLVRKTKVKASLPYLLACRQAIRCLQGRTGDRGGFDDDSFDEKSHLVSCAGNSIAVWLYRVLRLQACYLLGNLAEARAMSEAASQHRIAVGSVVSLADHNFYTSLVLAAEDERDAGDRRAERLAALTANQEALGRWAESCPQNFRHKHLLIAAEIARLQGNLGEAARRYDEAIDGADSQGFLQDAALGNELAGRFYRRFGRRRIADLYLRTAFDGFARWGALAKVAMLEEEFPQVAELPWRASLSTIGTDGRALDLLSLLKAAGSIAGEVVLDRLLDRLLATCFEVAGATRGALVLEEAGQLIVRALASSGQPASLEQTPVTLSRDVPRTVIEHCHRACEPVVLGEAARRSGAFASDPYVREHRVRSAVALPVLQHARSAGVLYLENDLAGQTFTPARLEVLTVLTSQVAISLENSVLFQKLTREVDERKRAEAEAQRSVRLRDEFLAVASHELKTPVAALSLALEVLSRDACSLEPTRVAELARLADRRGRRLSRLTDDLLDVSRIQAGRLHLSLEAVDLGAVVRDAMEAIAVPVAAARCPVSLQANRPVVGHWDRVRVEQVVVNLVANAIKFGRGEPVEIGIDAADGVAELVVTDHGIGIPPDRLPHIFERFERAVPSENYGGLGLGLYIAREIISALGGSVTAESQVGVGSIFRVRLPLDGRYRAGAPGAGG